MKKTYAPLGLSLVLLVVLVIFISSRTVSYPPGFPDALAKISTTGWKTYVNKHGWQVLYPPQWSVTECVNGEQVNFGVNPKPCDVPGEGDLTVVGPMQQNEAMYNAKMARIALQYNLNGLAATRYMDALCGQAQTMFCEIVLVPHMGQYYSLNLWPESLDSLTAEKILSTFKFMQ